MNFYKEMIGKRHSYHNVVTALVNLQFFFLSVNTYCMSDVFMLTELYKNSFPSKLFFFCFFVFLIDIKCFKTDETLA